MRAYIGLGSNRGDRVGYVQQAMQLFKDIPGVKVVECSSLYETETIPNQDTPWFVNAVAAIETNLTVRELQEICKDIEVRLNELQSADLGQFPQLEAEGISRAIDLDILFFGDQVIDSDNVRVPHPTVVQKAYALVPLLEIAPDLVHPKLNKTVAQLHEELPEPELVYLYGTRGQ